MVGSTAPNAMTILLSSNRRACAKTFRPGEGGAVEATSYGKEYLWSPRVVEVNDLGALQAALESVGRHEIAIHGALLDDHPAAPIPRRLYAPEATITAVPRSWLAIDFDDAPAAPGRLLARLAAVKQTLPAPFQRAGAVWQLTSSYGMGAPDVIRCRFWFLLDEPVQPTVWKYYLRGIPGVDGSIYTANQPIYVCPPTFEEGLADPAPRRFGVAPGDERVCVADLDLAEATALATAARSCGDIARLDIEPCQAQIDAAVQKILGQEPKGARHEWMVGAACELYALGADPELIVDTCEECLRLHGREPDPGEAARAAQFAARKHAQGLLRTTNPALSTLLPPQEEAELPPVEPDEELLAATAEADAARGTMSKGRTHVSNAEIFVAQEYGAGRYIRAGESDYAWTGKAWRVLEQEELEGAMTRAARALPATFITNVAKAARRFFHRPGVEAPCWIDEHGNRDHSRQGGYAVSLRNGVLRAEDALINPATALRPHTDRFFSTVCLPFDYDPSAKCPTLLRCLEDWFPTERDTHREIQKMFGYLVAGDNIHQKIFVLAGQSRAGKGVLAGLITQLIGADNTASTSLKAFGGAHGLEGLPGKRVLFINEANAQKSSDIPQEAVDRIKAISGGDAVSVNPKHKTQRSTTLEARIVLTCNRPPRIDDSSWAITNRMVLFHFQRSFAGREDPHLAEKLRRELPGIFNWALAGVQALLEDGGFAITPSSRGYFNDVRRSTSPVGAFIEDCIGFGAGLVLPANELYAAYVGWARDQGVERPSPKYEVIRLLRADHPSVLASREGARTSLMGVGLNELGVMLSGASAVEW